MAAADSSGSSGAWIDCQFGNALDYDCILGRNLMMALAREHASQGPEKLSPDQRVVVNELRL